MCPRPGCSRCRPTPPAAPASRMCRSGPATATPPSPPAPMPPSTAPPPGYVRVDPPNQVDWLGAVGANITLTKDQTTTTDFTITRRLYSSADIRVVDAASGEPIVGAEVSGGTDFDAFTTQLSDADG